MNAAMNRGGYDGENKFTGDMLIKAFSIGSNKKYTTEIDKSNDVAYVGISVQRNRGDPRISYIGRVKNEEEGALKGGEPIERIGALSMKLQC